MPELPEVETVVRDLRPLLEGRRLVRVRAGNKPLRRAWTPKWQSKLTGAKVAALRRRGKWIIIDLDVGNLLVHLGMTGQLTTGAKDRPVASHTHVFVDLDDGTQLRFRDVRRFGSMTLFETANELDAFLAERVGPEPFDVTSAAFRSALAATSRPLKAALLDQMVIAGVGNIYADEALFESALPPTLPACDALPNEVERLRNAIARVLMCAVEGRGSTIRNYVGGSGLRGSYQDEFRAYGRTGKPCYRCGTTIVRIRLAGRSTHYCPSCQKRA